MTTIEIFILIAFIMITLINGVVIINIQKEINKVNKNLRR